MLAGWLLKHDTASFLLGWKLRLQARIFALRVLRIQKAHVTVALMLRLVICVELIVLVRTAVWAPVEVCGRRSDHSTVAARAVLAWARVDIVKTHSLQVFASRWSLLCRKAARTANFVLVHSGWVPILEVFGEFRSLQLMCFAPPDSTIFNTTVFNRDKFELATAVLSIRIIKFDDPSRACQVHVFLNYDCLELLLLIMRVSIVAAAPIIRRIYRHFWGLISQTIGLLKLLQ